MRMILKAILPVLGLVLWLNGVQASAAETDDVTITTTIKEMLAKQNVALTGIAVNSSLGVVMLSGVVNSLGEKGTAESVAKSVGGVRHVINNLQVSAQTQAPQSKLLQSPRPSAPATAPNGLGNREPTPSKSFPDDFKAKAPGS